MNIKERFESTFVGCDCPETYYIKGNMATKFFVISKYEGNEFYTLSVLDYDKNCICLKADTFDNLIKIVDMLTYSFSDKVYYERCPE